VKLAALMRLRELAPEQARARLQSHGDSLQRALEETRAAGSEDRKS